MFAIELRASSFDSAGAGATSIAAQQPPCQPIKQIWILGWQMKLIRVPPSRQTTSWQRLDCIEQAVSGFPPQSADLRRFGINLPVGIVHKVGGDAPLIGTSMATSALAVSPD